MRPLKEHSVTGKSGFTLIELLVVIAIISLMASMGSGLFTGTLERLKLDKAANSLFLATKYARMVAIENQTRYRLCLDTTNQGFYLVTSNYFEDTGLVEDYVVSDHYSKPVSFPEGIQFEQMEIILVDDFDASYSELPTVVFKPDGTAQTAAIQIGDGNLSYTISINSATGQSKMILGTVEDITITTRDLDIE